jgi:hypothetical protein
VRDVLLEVARPWRRGTSVFVMRAEVAAPGFAVKRANCGPSMRISVA